LPPDEPIDEEKLEILPDDYDTPFSLPVEREVDIADEGEVPLERPELDSTHPMTDSDLDETDLYNEGIAGAAGVSEPNPDDTVISYHPPKRQQRSRKS